MADKKKILSTRSCTNLTTMASTVAGFLKCMAWAGNGLVWTMCAGVRCRGFSRKHYGGCR